MRQYRKQCSSSGEDIRCEVGIAALDSWDVNFVQRFAKETGIAPTDYCQEKRLHCPEIIRKLRRDSQIMAIEAPVGLLPSLDSFTPEPCAKVVANEGMGIQIARLTLVFGSAAACSSYHGYTGPPLGPR